MTLIEFPLTPSEMEQRLRDLEQQNHEMQIELDQRREAHLNALENVKLHRALGVQTERLHKQTLRWLAVAIGCQSAVILLQFIRTFFFK